MSEVVPFPRPARIAEDRTASSSAFREQDAAERHRLTRLARANIGRRPYAEGLERVRIARNLWLLLDRVEREHGVSKARVLHKAGQGGEGDSTKRLPRFALRPGLTEEEYRARASKLNRAVKGYVAIAEAAADLAGSRRDDLLLELLNGSPYLTASGDTPDVEPWYDRLSELLNLMGRVIARDHDLAGYFAFVARHALTTEDAWISFKPGTSDAPTPFSLVDGGTTLLDEVYPLLPKIFLAETEIRRGVRAELVLSPEAEPANSLSSHHRLDFVRQSGDACPIDDGPSLPAEVRLHRRLWLCLAPIGPAHAVVPAFFEGRHFEVWATLPDSHTTLRYTHPGEPPSQVWIPVDRRSHEENGPRFVDALLIRDAVPRERTPPWAETDATYWSRGLRHLVSVTPSSCRDSLGCEDLLLLFEDPREEDPDSYENTYDCWFPEAIVEAPPHTLAAAIEENLCYAEGDQAFETRLILATARRVEALNTWRREQEAALVQAREELLRRWSRDG